MATHLSIKEVSKENKCYLDRSIYYHPDRAKGVYFWGKKNDYPEFFERLINNSPTAKLCVKTRSRFFSGLGFENEQINKVVIGVDFRGKEVTLQGMLISVCNSLAMFNGAYIHGNFTLEQVVKNTRYIPFKYIRFSKEDDSGYTAKVAHHRNWDRNPDFRNANNRSFDKNEIGFYDIWNSKKEVFNSLINSQKGESLEEKIQNYSGQVNYLFLDNEYTYPSNPFESVYLDLDSENQNSIFRNRQLRDGFLEKQIFRVPETINSETNQIESNSYADALIEMCGVDGAPALVMNCKTVSDSAGNPTLEKTFEATTLDSTIDPDIFNSFIDTLYQTIRRSNMIPSILIDFETGGLGADQAKAVQSFVDLYNAHTNDVRILISEFFKEIYQNFDNPILKNNTNWNIKKFSLNITENANTGTANQF